MKNTLKAFSFELIFVAERKKEILNALLRMLAYPKQNLTHSNISGHFLSMNNQFPAHSILVKSTVMRKTAKAFNISGWLFPSLIAKSKVPVHTYYLPH